MVLLIVQLARFGDIFQTWPALRALRRSRPGDEIHLLVRESFVDATVGLEELGVKVHVLPTADILAPILSGHDDELNASREKLAIFLQDMTAVKANQIVNLSFSPFSSYLVDALSGPETTVAGFTRFTDGYLGIPDDTSAYFYAQVGVGRHNRYHVCDIFAAVAGVDLIEADFYHPDRDTKRDKSIIIHIGASETEKAYPPEMWVEVIRLLIARVPGPIVLVGSPDERPLSETIASQFSSEFLINRVGQSGMSQLCTWIAGAKLVIGADSAPVQIASLVGAPVLNLSCAKVNFWETGPLTLGSIVLYSELMAEILPQRVAGMVMHMLGGSQLSDSGDLGPYIIRLEHNVGYIAKNSPDFNDYYWRLIQALYTASDYPPLSTGTSTLGFQRLYEVAQLAVDQCTEWKAHGPSSTRTGIMESVDEMLIQIPELSPEVGPVVSWFQTERIRIGPTSPDEVLRRTRELFQQLALIAAVYYRPTEDHPELLAQLNSLIKTCVPAIREFEFSTVRLEFQELLSKLHQLANSSTKVGGDEQNWSSVLRILTDALSKRDFVEVADILEFGLEDLVRDKSSGHANIVG